MAFIDFQQLGLSENEGSVYTSLLEIGGGYVSAIARRSDIPRVNCYHTLENLLKKGLVSFVTKNKVRYYTAEPPQKLVNMLEEKSSYAHEILPQLKSMSSALAFKPQIRYFEGMEGIKNILEDTLTTKNKELLGYSNLKGVTDILGDHMAKYAEQKLERKIKTRIICPSSKAAFNYLKKFYPKDLPAELMEILYVNPKEFWFEHEILIFDNKVAVISLNKDELIGMIFESKGFARSQTAIFNLAWLGASGFIAL